MRPAYSDGALVGPNLTLLALIETPPPASGWPQRSRCSSPSTPPRVRPVTATETRPFPSGPDSANRPSRGAVNGGASDNAVGATVVVDPVFAEASNVVGRAGAPRPARAIRPVAEPDERAQRQGDCRRSHPEPQRESSACGRGDAPERRCNNRNRASSTSQRRRQPEADSLFSSEPSWLWVPGYAGPLDDLVERIHRRIEQFAGEAGVERPFVEIELFDGVRYTVESLSPEPGTVSSRSVPTRARMCRRS